MSNKFLSRGKRLEIGQRIVTTSDEWIYGYYVYGSISTYIYSTLHNPKMVSVDPKTVGRCIGLTDKNGKMIFEGDIIKNFDGNDIGVVKWYSKYAAFMVRRISDNQLFWLYYNDFSKIEIVGNIHDNPELIGGNENERN